jgi:hypothetical protein
MDGKTLQKNDAVYDLLYGDGVVLTVTPSIYVKFARVNQSYDESGFNLHWKLKTLFWHKPIITPVPHDMKHYSFLRDAVEKITAVVNGTWENFSK